MNILEILEYDSIHNQEDVSAQEMLENYYELKAEGFEELLTDKTIFMFKVEDNVVFYHTANAAPKEEYIKTLKDFFLLFSLQGFKVAYTTLENPKLKTIIKRYLKDSTVIVENKAVTILQ